MFDQIQVWAFLGCAFIILLQMIFEKPVTKDDIERASMRTNSWPTTPKRKN